MSEIQLKATSVENKPTWEMESSAGILQLKATNVKDKPVRIGDLPIIKTNILENARQYDKGVVGGYNGTFPLTAASQGGIYLLPSTGKFYVCETAYNGAQISAPNSNFVELSVWKNHDRLNKLITVGDIVINNLIFKFYKNIILNFSEGTAEFSFEKPFPNECILAYVMDEGISSFEIFTVGYITSEKFVVQSKINASYSGSDSVSVIAIGY